MRRFLSILLILITLPSIGQEVDCQKIRDSIPYAVQGTTDLTPLLQKDLEIIAQCIELDTLDKQMINPTSFGLLFFKWSTDNPDLRYAHLIDSLDVIVKSEQYLASKEGLRFAYELENKKVNSSDDRELRSNLKRIGFSDLEIEEIIDVISSSDNPDLTYKEAVTLFISSKETPVRKNQSSSENEPLFGHFSEIDSFVNLKNQKGDKTKLLYFTGWASVSGRKLESAFFNDLEIRELFAEYDCYVGYADDKSTITSLQQNEFPEVEMKNKGQFIVELQKALSNKDTQPVLIVLDSNWEYVDSFEYSLKKKDLIEFLEKNKNVR